MPDREAILNFLLIVLISTIQLAVVSGIKPLISLHATALGISPAQISLFIASYALLPAVFSIQIGKWVDRFGLKRIAVVAHLAMAGALALGTAYPGFVSFLVQQAVLGISATFLIVTLQKRLGGFPGNMDKLTGNFMLGGSIGAMLGPIITTFTYDKFGYSASGSVDIALVLAGLLCALSIRKTDWDTPVAERKPQGIKQSVWALLAKRDLRNAIFINGLVLANRELFASYFPLLAHQMGITPTRIGMLMACYGVATLGVRLIQTRLIDRWGRLEALMYSLFVSGIAYFIVPYSPSLIALFLVVMLLGGGLSLGQPISLTFALQESPPDRQGELLGLRVMVNRAFQLSLPLAFGGISGLAGVTAVFWACGLVLSFFGYAIRPIRRKDNAADS